MNFTLKLFYYCKAPCRFIFKIYVKKLRPWYRIKVRNLVEWFYSVEWSELSFHAHKIWENTKYILFTIFSVYILIYYSIYEMEDIYFNTSWYVDIEKIHKTGFDDCTSYTWPKYENYRDEYLKRQAERQALLKKK